MLSALLAGFLSVRRNPGLVLVVLGTNLLLGLLVAARPALRLGTDLANRGTWSVVMYGFGDDWWAEWSERQEGFSSGLDPAILGAGLLYLLLQVFLTGGLVGVFRAPWGGWTARSLARGSAFYFGRMLRVSLLALAAAGAVVALHRPLAGLADDLAREAVSGRTALLLTLASQALLLLGLVLVHMVASHAKVLVVREERLSAVLAVVSSLGFCARNLPAALGQYAAVGAAGVCLLALFGAADDRLTVVGWRSQALALALFQAFLAGRIVLRLGLLASQLELQERRR